MGREDPLKTLGRHVRALREAKGWSQEFLAEVADVHRTYLGDIERGIRNPSLKSLLRIADALDTSLAKLVDGIPPVRRPVPKVSRVLRRGW